MASLVVQVAFSGPKGVLTVPTLVDTGAEMSLVSKAVADRLGLPILGNVSVHGAGRATVEVAKVRSIEIPGARMCKTGPTVVFIFGKGTDIGTGIHAILGYDFMQKSKMRIDVFTKTGAIRCGKKR